jgi:hypothetical protein
MRPITDLQSKFIPYYIRMFTKIHYRYDKMNWSLGEIYGYIQSVHIPL